MNRNLATSCWLALACATTTLSACNDTAPTPADAATGAVSSPVLTAPAAYPAADPGCRSVSQSQAFSSRQGTFAAVECAVKAEDGGVTLHFTHRGEAGGAIGTYRIDPDTLQAVVSDTLFGGLKFWDGHILTLDLPQERGGSLIIANWTGQAFVFSEYAYETGDEDSMELRWDDGGFLIETIAQGKRRLRLAGPSDPGRFAQEALACSLGAGRQMTRLALPVDVRGDITGLSYTSSTPAADGTALGCAVDAENGDGQAEWRPDRNGLLIIFERDPEDTPDGPEDPDRVRITRKDDVVTVDFDLFPPHFCGQSSEMARQIVLKKGTSTCAAVR